MRASSISWCSRPEPSPRTLAAARTTRRARSRGSARPAASSARSRTTSFGQALRRALADDGVGLELVVDTPLPTTLAVAELDGAGTARYAFYFEGTSAPALASRDAQAIVAAPPSALHVGTLGLLLEPVGSTLEALATALPDDVLLFLDPNCRPVAVRDADAYRGRLLRLLPRADVVKVSADDLAFLLPGLDATAAAERLVELGARLVLLTDGARTVVVRGTDGLAFELPVPAIADVVDSVGAGDAFGAGVLAWWTERGLGRAQLGDVEALRAAVAFGCRVAGETCRRAGADSPTRAELGLPPIATR